MNKAWRTVAVFALVLWSSSASAAIVMVNGAGNTPQGIQSSVDQFRALLGPRLEINWDGVPDAFSSPNPFPATFFNVNSPRGAVFTTPGTGFLVSADSSSPPIEFGDLNPTYPGLFAPFSPERLFTPVGSNILDVLFFLPGTTTPAGVSGFGAVFSDVDLADTTRLQFFDLGGALLHDAFVLSVAGDETFSFLGAFGNAGELIGRVRITLGSAALGPNELAGVDLVVLDDFIYGAPRLAQVPEPGSLALVVLALAALLRGRSAARFEPVPLWSSPT